MKSIVEMSQAEIGAYVHSHLRAKGIDVILSGGAAAGIHSAGEYVSKDLDLVRGFNADWRSLKSAMGEIGFEETEARYFKHPRSAHFIEFLAGPLAIGDEPIGRVVEIEFSTGTLRVISATDSVKDRLASYYYFGDSQGLVQAVMVARRNAVDIQEIRRWSRTEGQLAKFRDFVTELATAH